MIIRVKKRVLALASVFVILTIAFIFAISVPLIYAATVNTTTGSFGVWIVISNQVPTNVTLGNVTGFAVDPISGSDAVILILFNASDPDGVENINGTDAGARVFVNLTLGTFGAQFRTSSTCTNYTDAAAGHVVFNCTINMRYYDNQSSNWVINITVIDANDGIARNSTSGASPNTFTFNSLAAFSMTANHPGEGSNLNFSSLNIGDANKPGKAPILLNNTGNTDFDAIKIIGADLLSGSNTLAIGSFAVNSTNNTAGRGAVMTASNVTIRALAQTTGLDNQTFLHGPGISGDIVPYTGATDTLGNISLYFFIDVPTGLATGTYNNTWNITVVDLP